MPETRTIEQTEHTVETVEHTEIQCPNCNQWFPEDKLHKVGIDYTPTVLCGNCSSAVFGHDEEPEGVEDTQTDSTDDTERSSTGGSISITLIVGAVVLFVGLQVMHKFSQSVSSAEFQQAAQETATSAEPAFGFIGTLFTVTILGMVIWLAVYGPRA